MCVSTPAAYLVYGVFKFAKNEETIDEYDAYIAEYINKQKANHLYFFLVHKYEFINSKNKKNICIN